MTLEHETQPLAVDKRRRRRNGVVGASAAVGVVGVHAAAYAFFANRNPYSQTIFAECPILHLTGFQCPGCGGTRSVYSLLHGDVLGSLAMNPLIIGAYLTIIFALLGAYLGARGRTGASRAANWAAIIVGGGAALWSTLIRNLF